MRGGVLVGLESPPAGVPPSSPGGSSSLGNVKNAQMSVARLRIPKNI
jgi:hypothetical protein